MRAHDILIPQGPRPTSMDWVKFYGAKSEMDIIVETGLRLLRHHGPIPAAKYLAQWSSRYQELAAIPRPGSQEWLDARA